MDTKIKPGHTAPAAKADYTAIAQAVSEHNDAAQPGQRYWGVALADGTYMVYEAGTVPPHRPPRSLLRRKRPPKSRPSGRPYRTRSRHCRPRRRTRTPWR